MGYKHQPLDFDKAREEITKPTFLLKFMPDFDGNLEYVNSFRLKLLI